MKKQGKRMSHNAYHVQHEQTKGDEYPKLNRLFAQIIASAALFLLVFVGGGLIPSNTVDVFDLVGETVRRESQLLEAVETLGGAVKEGESWQSALAEVFLPVKEDVEASVYWEAGEVYRLRLHPTAWLE